MRTDLSDIPATSASVALVSDEGTVFEAQGQVKARYSMENEADWIYPQYHASVPVVRNRKLCIYVEITEFEGSLTVPSDLIPTGGITP